ncbi:alpha/beta fold hydrolase [Streptomyces anandii]|uniref:alpha/beta hydrolase n=1 Tax=Streptomyces anandii TaxID=285454 RepID=UPI0036F827FF
MKYLEAADRAETFVPHAYPEHLVDLGEIRMNYVVAGEPTRPALLLIPAQTESWWGYERVIPLLADHFQVYAVDLRGQGRSTWTPGRYTLDNFGNDLVRFIDLVIGRETIVSGLSSGGTISAWLAAFAKPGQIRAAVCEDAPLFASEVDPSTGQSIRQAIGPMFRLWSKWLGDQWSIGNWEGMQKAAPRELPAAILKALAAFAPAATRDAPQGPPQELKEYDPEWGRAFTSGLATASCDHENMLAHVRVPVLFTHHFHQVDEATGTLVGALSDLQVRRAEELITAAGQRFTCRAFPEVPHSMHGHDPETYARTVIEWATAL